MRLRNNIFAAAFDYLKRNTDIKTQKELARRMGVTENTITRILKDYTDVTEDIITKLQTASGCIFNLQWLRGEDPIHMLAEDLNDGMAAQFVDPEKTTIDQSSLVNALLAAKDETISSLKSRISDMERTIKDKETIIHDRDARIADLERKLAEATTSDLAKYPFAFGTAEEKELR